MRAYCTNMMQHLTVNELLKEKEEVVSQDIKRHEKVMFKLKKNKDEAVAKANFRGKQLNTLLAKHE